MKGFTVLSLLLSLYNDPNLNLFCPKIANRDTQNEVTYPSLIFFKKRKAQIILHPIHFCIPGTFNPRAGEGSETRVYYSYSQSPVTQVHTAGDIFLSSMWHLHHTFKDNRWKPNCLSEVKTCRMPPWNLCANSYEPAKLLRANQRQSASLRGDISLSNHSWPYCKICVSECDFPELPLNLLQMYTFKLWNTLNIQKGINNNIMMPL